MSRDRDRSLLAVFTREADLVGALGVLRGRNLSCRVYSPARCEEALAVLGLPPSPIRFLTLAGFLSGTVTGFALCAFTALRWGLIVSGKPVLAWVPFVVVAFELSVLLGVLSTLAGMLLLGRLPGRRLPSHYDPRFSSDRFGLLVRPGPEAERVAAELRDAGAEDVRDVEG